MFIEEVLEHADLITEENDLRRVDVDYFEFGYDYSILHRKDDIVLRATFRLTPAREVDLRKIMTENLAWRALRHPPLDTEPSVGSIFKKIQGIGAGRLIDECGLKGASFGGIVVTHRHANIMVNQGGGTAADVQALVAYIQKEVAAQTGYHLETEIDFVGEFDPPTSGSPRVYPPPTRIDHGRGTGCTPSNMMASKKSSSWANGALAVLRKDLQLELRNKSVLGTLIVFVLNHDVSNPGFSR